MSSVTVFGSINVDLVVRVETFAVPGETVLSRNYEKHFGGKGANQAVAASRALGAAGRVTMAGAVGEDQFARDALLNLEANNVCTDHIAWVDAPTGCAFITVDGDGENSITVASGANNQALTLNPPVSDVVLLQMEIPLAENLSFARSAKGKAATVILNLAPVPSLETGLARGTEIRDLLRQIDYLIVNEHELSCLCSHLNLVKAADSLIQTAIVSGAIGCSVITTLGGEGAVLATASGTKTYRAPASKSAVVDTTGAGDTFCGVFSAAIAEGLPANEALVLGVDCATKACQSIGAQSGMPHRSDIRAGSSTCCA